MAMLADRKRKQKFVILDRNVNKSNNWSKDSNKFGQKMLERMGWKEGKGLGRNEDGLTDYVKVAYKNNSKGMGFKDSVEWSAQQDNFNALLGELSTAQNDTNDQPKEIKSLEEKSQNSRARVHYRKFTRGKDLSRYSQKDLANIFGRKKLDKDPEEVAAEIQEEEKGSKGVFTTSGSMVDYFKNKMKSNVNKMKSNEDVNDSGEEQASYGFGFNASSSLNGGDEMTTKKNKKNKQKDTFVSDKVDTKKRKGELSEVETTPSKKLKFEARSKKLKSEEQGLINPAFEPLCSNIPIKKHLLDTINEDEVPSPNECENEKSEIMEESVIEESKPKKKKKKVKTESLALDNPAFNDEVGEDLEQEEKRKKNKKSLDLNISVDGDEVKRKKNKNLKGLDNPALNIDDFENKESVQNFEVKRKKKKSKLTLSESQDNKGIENSALEITDGELVNTTVTPKPNKITPRYKFKNILFNKTKQEIVIPTRSPGDIDKRNELYDINTKVIQDGLCDLKKQPSTSQNFDIKSIDKIDFCDDSIKLGIDNRGFDVRAQTVEESVNSLTKTIDNYQAEVENGINESKMKKSVQEEENEIDEEGVVLQFKHAKFNKKTPAWVKGNDASACLAKKSYKHLIKGDIVVAFKKTNLHQIDGYAITK